MARIVREPPREEKHLLASDLHSATVNVELRHLHYFVAVAEELHFTRAAARVHIAQQPLSAAIARLEQQLGVTLLERTTRRVQLTEAGEALLEPARAALRAVDEALAAAPAAGPDYNAAVLGVLAAAGVAPPTRELPTHHDAWQNAILDDGCVGLTVRSAIHSSHRGLHLLAVEPRTTFPLDLLWREEPPAPPRPPGPPPAALP